MRIHPRPAVGIFGLIYITTGIIIERITNKDILGNIFFIIVGLVICSFVYDFFQAGMKNMMKLTKLMIYREYIK